MENIARLADMLASWTQKNALLRLSNGWQVQMRPASLIEKMGDEVVDVQSLHHDDDCVLDLIVEPGEQSVAIPLHLIIACQIGIGVLRLERIVQDDEISAAAGERAPDRCRQSRAPRRGGEFRLGVLGR